MCACRIYTGRRGRAEERRAAKRPTGESRAPRRLSLRPVNQVAVTAACLSTPHPAVLPEPNDMYF